MKKEKTKKISHKKAFPKSTKKKLGSRASYTKLAKKYSSEIKKYKDKVNLMKSINKFAIPSILVIAIITVLIFYRPVFIGYFAVGGEEEHVSEINKLFVENSSYLFSLEEGELKSLKINGQLIGEGIAKVYLEAGNESYLVFDSNAREKEGISRITGLAVEEFNETQGTDETIGLNETLNETEELNETIQINETIGLNETLNETEELNETIQINETIGLNETLENITNPPEDAEILIELGYNDGTDFDIDNNGIEAKGRIIDFNVNAEFNWDVNEDNLCTKWETESLDNETSVAICYGNEKCCNFIGLDPLTSNWDEIFYSYYGRYGATSNNKISAQVLYADYSLDEGNLYYYVYYSDWDSLNAIFLGEEEKVTEFNDICIETCLLSLNETSYKLRVELENAILMLDSIGYTIIPKEEEKENIAPVLLIDIPDIIISKNSKFSIDLNEYFSDQNNDLLGYVVYEMEDISVLINESIAALIPKKGFTGVRHTFIIANDSKQIAVSNVFMINVTKDLVVKNITVDNITFFNISEMPTQLKAEINKPVKWIKIISAENSEAINKTINVSFTVPGYASNISVKDVKLNKLIEKDKVTIKDKTKTKTEKLKTDKKEINETIATNEIFVLNETITANETAPADGTQEPDTSPPNPIKSLQVINKTGVVVLSWTNPDNPDFESVKVLRKQEVYPDVNYSKAISDSLVVDITDKALQTTLLDDAVTANITYYYRIYSYDNSFNYASGQGVLATVEGTELDETENRSIELNETITLNGSIELNETNDESSLEIGEKKFEFPDLFEANETKEYIVEYETSAPVAVEINISTYKKQVVISSDVHYTNVLAYTSIPIEVTPQKIRLYWIRNNTKELFTNVSYYDLNNNSLIDRIEWIIPSLSDQTFEIEIEVLNVQSYPTVGGNWTVMFNTTGTANLTITAVNMTSYSEIYDDSGLTIDDLEVLELRCGDKILFSKDSLVNNKNLYFILDNGYLVKLNETIGKELRVKSLFAEDYYCNSTGYHTVKVLTPGEHNQELRFNDQIAYAHNFATDLIKASTVYYEFNCPKCAENYNSNPVNFCPMINHGQEMDDFEAEISFGIEYVDQVSSASVCAYQHYSWHNELAINYIEIVNSTELSAAPEIFSINESWVNKIMLNSVGWKCINITTFVQDSVENNETKLYARWWGQDMNGSIGPFACFKGIAPLDQCDGNNPSGALDCRPYLNIT